MAILHARGDAMPSKRGSEVVVVGAGPVGLLTAISLKTAGVDVQVYDAGQRTAAHSYALVLHPATLRLLDRFGLGASCTAAGRVVTQLGVYDGPNRRNELDFTRVSGPHPHVVVLPQSRLEAILETALQKCGVDVHWVHRVQALVPAPDTVKVTVARLDKVSTGYPVAHTEVVVDKLFDVETGYVVGADGYDSFVRRRLGITYSDQGKGQIYSVFQFATGGDVPADGRLMVFGERVGGYWPLPDGRCRFSFPIGSPEEHRPDTARLGELLASWAPWFRGDVGAIEWTALGLFERKLATTFGEGRIWMAGDAAHLTGPLGGQSMNVGLREADDLAGRLVRVLRPGAPAGLLDDYNASRAAEWRILFGAQTSYGSRDALLLPCLPASGPELDALIGQLS
jgi:2-polyprenyl-6-methoxyphenol hydroxylase-like FAD-dependent oxidoreductase